MEKPRKHEKQKETTQERKKNKIKALVAKIGKPKNMAMLGAGVLLLLCLIVSTVYYLTAHPSGIPIDEISILSIPHSSTLSSDMSSSLPSSDIELSSNTSGMESDMESEASVESDNAQDNIADSHQTSTTPTTKPSGGGNTTVTASKATPSKAPSSTAPAPSKAPSSAPPPPASSAPPVEPEEPAPVLVNINTATQSELMTLTGINISLAKKIIAHREMIGGFTSTEQLMDVYGIDQRIYNRIKDNICV